jgi:uncharacterized membrane protein YdjX (TVP38/TMEM64 family)
MHDESSAAPEGGQRAGGGLGRGQLVAIALLVCVLLAWWLLPVRDWLIQFLAWTEANPGGAWASFVLIYVLATVCFLPATPLTLAAGAIFGLGAGFALVSLSSTLGATAAFLVGRTLARDWVSARMVALPRFQALDRGLQTRGFWIVLLTRLSPVFPFFLLNYAYGVSAVRLRHYVPASWLGMMPGTLAYVYAGSLAADLAQIAAGDVAVGGGRPWLLGLGLLATIAVTVLVTRIAGRELQKEIAA